MFLRRVLSLFALALLCACVSIGEEGDDCTANSDCLNDCCFDNGGDDNWCSFSGTGCVSGGGGGGSNTGACAYLHHSLNRLLCDANSSASSCSGKFMGAGTTCQGFSCTTHGDPNSCSVPGGGGGGGGGSCENAWTCAYDGQASPMCSWACTKSGSERRQTCDVLAGMLTSGNPGTCCPVCR